ncbi:unnamed protein product [Kuraishia capsulata CBS 1993]|uniref:Acid phosphatase n=1 Tax=Kuraishia capsulata CBS 1993 TaxID=1382522 RepID=W6MU34_9ASCO|nr:uncharacterized protein KUCA_T00004832001 [Kuraishia capsulata CBS 1993]CDK28847.1 unnamed protein product [Kuraishia capsulata CBS 1993]
MRLSTATLLALAASTVQAGDFNNTLGNSDLSCVGTFVFGRHNDRTAKPSTVLTNYGATRQVASGSLFRERYFGLKGANTTVKSDYKIDGLNSEGVFVYGDTYAQAPASTVIMYSMISFMQGLYPPTQAWQTDAALADKMDEEMSNGTVVESPFNGYQYVFMDIQQDDSEDYIWINGDDSCPNSDNAIAGFNKTEFFKEMNASTYDFYKSLGSIIPNSSYAHSKLNFKNAMNVYDFMHVNYIHDEDLAKNWNETIMHKVSYLADAAQWGISYNASNATDPLTLGGQSLLGGVANYLNATKTAGSPYINYFVGSFNTMYQIGGLLQLNEVSDNFTGMPDYGSVYVFDLLHSNSTSDYYVQFSFRNGTNDGSKLEVYPLFGSDEDLMSWSNFTSNIDKVSIRNVEDWCAACGSTSERCTVYSTLYESAESLENKNVSLSELASGDYSSLDINTPSLSNAAAGGIGAGVTIGVFLLVGGFAYLLYRSKKGSSSVLPTSFHKETGMDAPSVTSKGSTL